jgi:hypothetical protein
MRETSAQFVETQKGKKLIGMFSVTSVMFRYVDQNGCTW